MIIAHNLVAMNAQRQYNMVSSSKAKSTEKLSSGYRINRAADDAAGLAISEKMRRQIRGLNQGAANIGDGISLCQVADGALSEVNDILQRMNELSVKSANGTNTDWDRFYIQQEINQLSAEINRIGSATSFNGIQIFDKATIEKQTGPITSLVTSPSGKSGKMQEAYLGNDGKYYPAASIDFTAVKENNIKQLDGAFFSFVCPYGCKETFNITFKNDGTGNSVTGQNGSTYHKYAIDISGCTNGSDVVSAIYDYVSANKPAGADADGALAGATGGVGVSHSSALVRNGNKLIVLSNTKFSGEQAAINYGKNLSGGDGAVNSSKLTSIMTPDPIFNIPIQCSGEKTDVEFVRTKLMNAEALTVENLNVSGEQTAKEAIDNVKFALNYIAELRSDIGAQQNRLEHAQSINLNSAENTTAAESAIRDTDMAKEMVQYSLKNVLEQAGVSMMTQANQMNQNVLNLLG